MSATTLLPAHHGHASEEALTPPESRVIDDSLRLPVLSLFANALHWLVVAAAISVVLSIKMIYPAFLGGINFLTYGRLAPVARDLFLYGWASQAALAGGIWLTARLAGRPLTTSALGGTIHTTLLTGATVLWNLAVLLGSLAILAGYSTGVEWLEYPGWASAALFLAFLLIGIWPVMIFDRRNNKEPEVAQWYLVAGFCSFPWIYGTANLLLIWKPVEASAQGPIRAWFSGSFCALWLLPVAIAALYAMIPRILKVHLYRRNLAPLGFWALLFLGGWNGMERVIGGPVPAWMTAVGVVSGVLLLIPVVIISINLAGGVFQNRESASGSVSLRFLRLGLFSFIVLGAVGAISSLPTISGALRFSGVGEAQTLLWVLGAVTLPLFGLFYEALPQLLERDCWSSPLSESHYWLTLVGFWLLIASLILGGLITGLAMSDATVTFLNIASFAYPFHILECLAQFLLLTAVATLGFNVTRAFTADYLFPKR